MTADVHFWPLPGGPGSELAPADPGPGLRRLVAAAGCAGAATPGHPWLVKVPISPPGRPAAVPAGWVSAVAAALAGATDALPPGIAALDTLSITTRGLDSPDALREAARARGFGGPQALPFVIGDDPQGPPPWPLVGGPEGHALAGRLAGRPGLAVLAPLRPHPHLGVAGAVAALGLDLADRASRLALHRGIRPQVDTPLCAGCGSCLDVCLYDAIVIRGGRAVIDHRLCTGCGECMGVCFMAGIAPEAAEGVARFQAAVAGAAAATARQLADRAPGPALLHVVLLVQPDSHATAARARRRQPLAGIGILAGRDPVAVDSAACDLLAGRLGGPLNQWSGYAQAPAPLLEQAAALGLGTRDYRLREV
jgi:ferredoxin